MAAMAKLWRFISPERIGFFLQKLEVLFASCYSIQNIFLRIFKVTGSGQIKMAQMSHFGTTAWCLSAGCFWLAEALTNTVWNCIIFDVPNVLTWFPIAPMSAIVCCMSFSWATHVEVTVVTWVSFSVQTLLLSQPAMPPSFYHSGIFNLIKRWRYVVDNDGDYCPDKFEV